MMNKKLAALGVYAVFWISFLMLSGTLNSGFHLTDDHEAVTFRLYMDDNGFIETCSKAITDDLSIRFRPFYYLYRVFLVWIFGTNFLLWSINNAILAIITSYLFFLFLFKQKYSFITSLLFPFLIMIGAQSAIWWRLGPSESIGLFLFSLSLYLLSLYLLSDLKRYKISLSLLCLLLASLSKESFLIMIPAYMLILLYIENDKNPDNSLFQLIKRNLLVLFVSLVFLSGIMFLITRIVGTNQIEYAGIDYSTSVKSYLHFIFSQLTNNGYFKIIVYGVIALLFSFFLTRHISLNTGKRIKSYLIVILIFGSVIIPQYVLYYKSGLWERYLIPLTFGYAFLITFLANEISKRSQFILGIYHIIILLTVSGLFRKETVDPAKQFAQVGQDTKKFFTTIVKNTNSSDTVLMVLDVISGYEWGFSIQSYLTSKERKNIRFYKFDIESRDDFEANLKNGFLSYFNSQMEDELNDKYPCIAIIPFKEQQKISNLIDSLYLNSYTKHVHNNFTVYTRRNIN